MADIRQSAPLRGAPQVHGLARWRAALPAALAIALLVTLLRVPAPLLVWNATSSSPAGLYMVRSWRRVSVGEMVIAWAPRRARRFAAERHYLPFRVPLVKRVAAVAGERICAVGTVIFVGGKRAALRHRIDPSGRRLPWWWSGCRKLRPGEIFLLSQEKPDAFDGRYFGVTGANEVIGQASLVWPGRK